VPRRVSLPGADELFRTTGSPALRAARPTEPAVAPVEERLRAVPPIVEPASAQPVAPPPPRGEPDPVPGVRAAPRLRPRTGERRPTGRERHDEKITVYVSNDELIDLEHARIVLRGEYGVVADRGRIVREAIAMVLADLEANGEASSIVRRLRGR
jgi:hypothetical protein